MGFWTRSCWRPSRRDDIRRHAGNAVIKTSF